MESEHQKNFHLRFIKSHTKKEDKPLITPESKDIIMEVRLVLYNLQFIKVKDSKMYVVQMRQTKRSNSI